MDATCERGFFLTAAWETEVRWYKNDNIAVRIFTFHNIIKFILKSQS